MSRVIIAFFVVLLPICINIPVFANEPLADFSGIKELITGQPDVQAIRDNIYNIEDVIKEDPKNYEAYSMLAFDYNYLGLYAKALEAALHKLADIDKTAKGVLLGDAWLEISRLCFGLSRVRAR